MLWLDDTARRAFLEEVISGLDPNLVVADLHAAPHSALATVDVMDATTMRRVAIHVPTRALDQAISGRVAPSLGRALHEQLAAFRASQPGDPTPAIQAAAS